MLHFSAGTRDILHSVSEDSDPLHTASDISYSVNCDRLMKFLRYSLAWVLVIKKTEYAFSDNFKYIYENVDASFVKNQTRLAE